MLRKDDPVYYKNKLQKLLKEAEDNNIEVYFDFVEFKDEDTGDVAGVYKNNVKI